MAIVNRSQKNFILLNPENSNLGPGMYNVNDSIIKKKSQYFLIKKSEEKVNDYSQVNPGPGHYETQYKNNLLQQLLQKQKQELYLIEKDSSQSNFKSATKRTTFINVQDIPGPGAYNINSKFKQTKSQKQFKSCKPAIIQQIFKSAQYKPVPSIPHNRPNQNQFYIQQQEQIYQDQLSKNQKQNGKQDRLLIHTSNQKKRLKHKMYTQNLKPGTSFSKSRSQRFGQIFQSNQYQNLGPGSYFLQTQVNSKKNQSKKKIKKKFIDYLPKEEKQQTTQITDDTSESSIQYVKDSIPGPGSYNIQIINTKFKRKNIQQFGVTSKRFDNVKKGFQFFCNFQQKKVKQYINIKKQKNIGFGSKSSSNIKKKQIHAMGPGYYQDPRSFEHEILKNIKKSYQGNFGSNQNRFEQKSNKHQNRIPISYIQENQPMKQEIKNFMFKSKCKREQKTNPSATLNYYSQDYNTIQKKIQHQKLQQQDRIVKKPGFNISQPRFKQKIRQKTNQKIKKFEIQSNQTQDKSAKSPTIPKAVQTATFQNGIPGPGSYNVMDKWNSRTFNILYLQ